MRFGLPAIAARQTPCKCCGALALLYGVVDFHKNCEVRRRDRLALSGVPIYYHRCPRCHFLFTTAFDHFTEDDFRRWIYNEDYLLVDPEYREVRPRENAGVLGRLFGGARPRRLLDYGGGHGALAELLRAQAYPAVETYDPLVPRFAAKPSGRFDCVVSFEVVEHAVDPARVFAEMDGFLADPGLIVFSTLLQPPDLDRQGLSWWYAGPRNGHVSLYSRASLERLAGRHGFRFGSFTESLHVLFRNLPDFARHLVQPRAALAYEFSTVMVAMG
jgi:SAM-dependent methyltransferase